MFLRSTRELTKIKLLRDRGDSSVAEISKEGAIISTFFSSVGYLFFDQTKLKLIEKQEKF